MTPLGAEYDILLPASPGWVAAIVVGVLVVAVVAGVIVWRATRPKGPPPFHRH